MELFETQRGFGSAFSWFALASASVTVRSNDPRNYII